MQSGLALFAAIGAVVLTIGLSVQQNRVNERLRISIDSGLTEGLEDRLARVGARLDGLKARLDGMPVPLVQKDLDTALDAQQKDFIEDISAVRKKFEDSDVELRKVLEDRFAANGARLDGLKARLDGMPVPLVQKDLDTALDAQQKDFIEYISAVQKKFEDSDVDLWKALEDRFAANGARLDGLKARLDGMPVPLVQKDLDTALDAQQKDFIEDISAVRKKFEDSDAELRKVLEDRFAANGARLDGLDSRLDGMPVPLVQKDLDTALDAQQKDFIEDISAVRKKFEDSDAELRKVLEDRIAANGARLDGMRVPLVQKDLDTALDAQQKDISAVQKKFEDSNVDLWKALEDRFAANGARLDGLESRLDGMPVPLVQKDLDTALDAQQKDFIEDISAVRKKFEDSDAELRKVLEDRFAANGARLDGLESRLDGMPVPLVQKDLDTALDAQQKDFIEDISAVRKKFEDSNVDLWKALEDRFAANGARLDGLKARLDGMPVPLVQKDLDTALDAQQKDFIEDISAVRKKFEDSNVDLWKALEGRFAANGARLDGLEARKSELNIDQLQKIGDVYFESGKFKLTSSAQKSLKSLMDDFRGTELVLVGSADSVGGEFYNATLSLLRATSVQRELEAVPDGAFSFVSVDGVGELGAPIETLDGTAEKQNRRVRIFSIEGSRAERNGEGP